MANWRNVFSWRSLVTSLACLTHSDIHFHPLYVTVIRTCYSELNLSCQENRQKEPDCLATSETQKLLSMALKMLPDLSLLTAPAWALSLLPIIKPTYTSLCSRNTTSSLPLSVYISPRKIPWSFFTLLGYFPVALWIPQGSLKWCGLACMLPPHGPRHKVTLPKSPKWEFNFPQ